MRKVIDLSGQKFGWLTVIKREHNSKSGKTMWLCECECGEKKVAFGTNLTTNHTTSCGCFRSELHSIELTTHGLSGTRIHKIYSQMKARCYNKNNKSYCDYGERGISICNEWLNKDTGLTNFYKWSIENGYDKELTIDRIDNNGNYEPLNCRWATKKEQNNNTRRNNYIEIDGVTKTVAQWSEMYDLSRDTIRRRMKSGLSGTDLIKKGRGRKLIV